MKKLFAITMTVLVLLFTTFAFAQPTLVVFGEANLAWDANTSTPEAPVDGYKLLFSETSGTYNQNLEVDVGNVTEWPMDNFINIPGLDLGIVYYCVCIAYNDVGESGHSNEITFMSILPPQGSPGNHRIIIISQ